MSEWNWLPIEQAPRLSRGPFGFGCKTPDIARRSTKKK